MVKCLTCGFEFAEGGTFCPKCGTTMVRRLSDKEISEFIFRRFGKKYDEALDAAYTALMYDLGEGTLHKDLEMRYKQDLLPREAEKHDEAVKRFMEKHERDPRLKEALSHYKLALIYENGLKVKEASKAYDHALELFPDFAPAISRRGGMKFVRKKLKDSLRDFALAGEVDPQFSLAFFHQGIVYKMRKKRKESLESYQRCVALDPDNGAAHCNMGLIYTDWRDFDNAIREFEEVLRITPNHPTGLKNLELAKRKIGRGLRKFF